MSQTSSETSPIDPIDRFNILLKEIVHDIKWLHRRVSVLEGDVDYLKNKSIKKKKKHE